MSSGTVATKKISKWAGKGNGAPPVDETLTAQANNPPVPEYFVLDEKGEPQVDGRKRLHVMISEDGKTIYPMIWSGMSPASAAIYLLQANIEVAMNAFNGMYQENEALRTQINGLNETLKMAMAKIKSQEG